MSLRLIASEIARRKFVEVNQAFLYVGIGALGTWLNQSCSVSVEAPASRTEALSAESFSKIAGVTVLIKWTSPRLYRIASISGFCSISSRIESRYGSCFPAASFFQ